MEKLWIPFPVRANMEMSSGSARRHGPPKSEFAFQLLEETCLLRV